MESENPVAIVENPLLPTRPYRKVTPTIRECFLELMRHGYGPTYAARELNVSYDAIRSWRDKDPEFKEAWEAAREILIDNLEDVCMERATKGTERPIVQKGERVYERDPRTGDLILDERGNPIPVVERVFSDTMAVMMLKANRNARYGDKVKHDVNVTHGVLRVPDTPPDEKSWEDNLDVIDVEAEETNDGT